MKDNFFSSGKATSIISHSKSESLSKKTKVHEGQALLFRYTIEEHQPETPSSLLQIAVRTYVRMQQLKAGALCITKLINESIMSPAMASIIAA
ncbi:MAG: hypothetical protein IJ785_06890 [Bacteroidales bacterium]|nr:hypothetical protein [Bacteroidales bacterium]